MGRCRCGGPVEGATVTIYNLDGTLIVKEENSTGPLGAFVISQSLPKNFNIVVTGGTLLGKPFDERLRLNVRNFYPEDWYHINYVTTMVSDYMEALPQWYPTPSAEEAEAAVAKYLGFPNSFTFDEIVDSMDYYEGFFSTEKFSYWMEEEMGGGGLDGFIRRVVVPEIFMGYVHSFADVEEENDASIQVAPVGSLLSDATKAMLSMIWTIDGEVVGEVDSIFSIIDNDDTSDALTKITGAIATLQSQITNLQISIGRIDVKIDQTAWKTAVNNLEGSDAPITVIKNHLKSIKTTAKIVKPKAKTPEEWNLDAGKIAKDKEMLRIRDEIHRKYRGYWTAFHNELGTPNNLVSIFTKAVNVISNQVNEKLNSSNWYLSYSRKLFLYQLKAYTLYIHEQKRRFGTAQPANFNAARDDYKTFRKKQLKNQAEQFVKNAERYALQKHPMAFFRTEFPCTNTVNTFLQKVDILAESLNPTFGFKNELIFDFTPSEGAFIVRSIFPVYPAFDIDLNTGKKKGAFFRMDPKTRQLKGVRQYQNYSLEGKLDLEFRNKTNAKDKFNVNAFPESATEFIVGYDPYGQEVRWIKRVDKRSTKNLSGIYVPDAYNYSKQSPLTDANPLIFSGKDSFVQIQDVTCDSGVESRVLKFASYHRYNVPALTVQLKTFHGQPLPQPLIWVKRTWWPNQDYWNWLDVYAGLKDKKWQEGKESKLLLKYTGNHCYTISTNHNPYHYFIPVLDDNMKIKEDRGHRIYAVPSFVNGNTLWHMYTAQNAKHMVEAIYFINPSYLSGHQMNAYGDWGDKPHPMFYGPAKQWGIWHSNDIRKIFPQVHVLNEWRFQ